jgi:hypothetical protein
LIVVGDAVADWVSRKLAVRIAPPYVAIGTAIDGIIRCGFVFNRFNGYNIEVNLASENGLTRGILDAVHDYAFGVAKAGRVTALTRRSNKLMRNMLPRLGFEPECNGQPLKRYYGPTKSDDAFVFVLFPEKAKYGQR